MPNDGACATVAPAACGLPVIVTSALAVTLDGSVAGAAVTLSAETLGVGGGVVRARARNVAAPTWLYGSRHDTTVCVAEVTVASRSTLTLRSNRPSMV